MKLYTPIEVARILQLKKHTILDLIRKGKIGFYKISERPVYRISENQIEEFLKNKKY